MARGRVKRDFRTASKENYEKFKQVHPGVNITFKQFEEIIRTWNKLFIKHILDTGNKVAMPYGFGPLSINKKKNKRTFTDKEGVEHIILPVNWKATNENDGKKVYYLNHHTEGYSCKWFWFVRESKLKMSELWVFRPSEKNKDNLRDYLFSPQKKYYQMYRQWYQRK